MAGQFVKSGATLECPLCSSGGKLLVSHTQVQLQDTPCATNGDRSKSNLVFEGVCNKWRKNKPPCASVIVPTQWQNVASHLEIDGEFMLLENSTIGCATGGVVIKIDDTAQVDVPTDLIEEPSTLKKFHINFRRGTNYSGEYGFDWLRDEYIYPIEFVATTFRENANNGYKPLALYPKTLKDQYYSSDVIDPISPYGQDYYPSWLSLFSKHTYWMFNNKVHNNGILLNLEIEALEELSTDTTILTFETSNNTITIAPSKINLSDALTTKQTKDLGDGTTKEFYVLEDAVNISCYRPIANHEEIKVFAELEGQKEEVGKLMIYNNSEIPTMEVVMVKVVTGGQEPHISNDFIATIQDKFLNEALIKMEITNKIEFDIEELSLSQPDVLNFRSEYLTGYPIYNDELSSNFFKELLTLYEKHGDDKPVGGTINSHLNKKTYIFYTSVDMNTEGEVPSDFYLSPTNFHISWGNSVFLSKDGYRKVDTIAHEIAHSLSLPHSFESVPNNSNIFHISHTDNIMDYYLHTELNTIKGVLFKWQWDIMRKDRSLVY